MKVPHVDIVEEKLGKEALKALQALFGAAQGQPPAVPVDRFRADHPQWLDELDDLEQHHALIERNRNGTDYLIRSYALPLIEQAHPVLEKMQHLYDRLREIYPLYLSEKQDINTLISGVGGNKEELLEALYYLTESHNVWSGKSNDFPYADESYLCISEGVLRQANIADILSQYYEWHYVNPQRVASQIFVNYDMEGDSSFFSRELKGGLPEWYEHLDDIKKALITEIDVALKNKLSALPTIGLRTLIDVVFTETVGGNGTFVKRLERFEQAGYITRNFSEFLRHVLDAGNAAAHRAYFPNDEDIETCLAVVKNLMESVYILQPKIERLKTNTPKKQ